MNDLTASLGASGRRRAVGADETMGWAWGTLGATSSPCTLSPCAPIPTQPILRTGSAPGLVPGAVSLHRPSPAPPPQNPLSIRKEFEGTAVLITGVTGYIGSLVLEQLLRVRMAHKSHISCAECRHLKAIQCTCKGMLWLINLCSQAQAP